MGLWTAMAMDRYTVPHIVPEINSNNKVVNLPSILHLYAAAGLEIGLCRLTAAWITVQCTHKIQQMIKTRKKQTFSPQDKNERLLFFWQEIKYPAFLACSAVWCLSGYCFWLLWTVTIKIPLRQRAIFFFEDHIKAHKWCQPPWLRFGWIWQAISQRSTSLNRRERPLPWCVVVFLCTKHTFSRNLQLVVKDNNDDPCHLSYFSFSSFLTCEASFFLTFILYYDLKKKKNFSDLVNP